MPQSAAALPIAPEDLATLRGWSAATHAPAVQVQRARILLLAAWGVANNEIAERLGVSRPTVVAWRKRSTREGLTSELADGPAVAAPRPCAGPGAQRSWPPHWRRHRSASA